VDEALTNCFTICNPSHMDRVALSHSDRSAGVNGDLVRLRRIRVIVVDARPYHQSRHPPSAPVRRRTWSHDGEL